MCVKSAVLVPDLHSCQQVAVIPSSAQYRKNVEATVGAHIKVLEKESDVGRIEAEIGLGPLENVLGMAEDELELATQVCECDSCLCVGIRRGRRVVVCVLTRAVCRCNLGKRGTRSSLLMSSLTRQISLCWVGTARRSPETKRE